MIYELRVCFDFSIFLKNPISSLLFPQFSVSVSVFSSSSASIRIPLDNLAFAVFLSLSTQVLYFSIPYVLTFIFVFFFLPSFSNVFFWFFLYFLYFSMPYVLALFSMTCLLFNLPIPMSFRTSYPFIQYALAFIFCLIPNLPISNTFRHHLFRCPWDVRPYLNFIACLFGPISNCSISLLQYALTFTFDVLLPLVFSSSASSMLDSFATFVYILTSLSVLYLPVPWSSIFLFRMLWISCSSCHFYLVFSSNTLGTYFFG